MSENILKELHPLEIKVLLAFKEKPEFLSPELVSAAQISDADSRRAIGWLQSKGLIELIPKETKTTIYLTDLGKKYLTDGTPEQRAFDFINKTNAPKMSDLNFLDEEERKEAIKFFKSNNIIDIQAGGVIVLKPEGTQNQNKIAILQELIRKSNNRVSMEKLDETEKSFVSERYKERGKSRNVFEIEKSTTYVIKPTEQGKVIINNLGNVSLSTDEITQLTPELLKDGSWRTKTFREFSFDIKPKRTLIGRPHPYAEFINDVRAKLLSMGFCEVAGEIVETEFWNLDALYMPQSHPARDVHGVYFVKAPKYAKTLCSGGASASGGEDKFSNAVSKTHENGGKTGSRGWGYKFDFQQAKRLVLRSHGTVLSARALTEHTELSGKYFTIARCFRPEQGDSTHAPDFSQLDGIVISKTINFRGLLGLLKLFAIEIAQAQEIKFTPSYFPFTEPSASVYAKHPKLGWIELGGAGIFRPEVTIPLGVKVPVIAWGLGLDRMAMLALNINDIRDLFSRDLDRLRQIK